MKTLRLIAVPALVAAGFAAGYYLARRSAPAASGERRILYWYDPMHPAYRSDKPGIAPDCNMALVPKYADDQPAAPAPTGKVLFYRDPQEPSYRADNPGFNPATGNELEPVYEGSAESLPPGSIEVSPTRRQLIGVRTGVVELTPWERTIRTTGRVVIDETRIAHVHTRTEGWVEQVFANFTGKRVERGQPLFTYYSPELVASQHEYLLARKAQNRLAQSTLAGVGGQTAALVEAARRRLEAWELSAEAIDELERTAQPRKFVTVTAPISGIVTARNTFPGLAIKPDMEAYTLVDLSRVWVVADVFEADAGDVRVGSYGVITLPWSPARRLAGRVTFILPQVDASTRTLKARLEVANPALELKPDLWVDVEFRLRGGARLTVPVDAVLDAGERKTVFVDRGNGYFEPRRVEIGDRSGDRVEIRSGLAAQERIAVSGAFLLDSESQLKAAHAPAGAPHQHD